MTRSTHYPRVRIDTFRLGDDMRRTMKERNISLRVVAAETDVSPATLHRLGTEFRAVSADTFMSVCWWLGKDPLHYIFDARRWRAPESMAFRRLNPDESDDEVEIIDVEIDGEPLRPDQADIFPEALREMRPLEDRPESPMDNVPTPWMMRQ